jgi:hypothetical protein
MGIDCGGGESVPRIATPFGAIVAIAAFPALHYDRMPIQIAEAFR